MLLLYVYNLKVFNFFRLVRPRPMLRRKFQGMSLKFRTVLSAPAAGIGMVQAQRTNSPPPPPPPPTVRKEFPETWIWQHSETDSECVIICISGYLGNHSINYFYVVMLGIHSGNIF